MKPRSSIFDPALLQATIVPSRLRKLPPHPMAESSDVHRLSQGDHLHRAAGSLVDGLLAAARERNAQRLLQQNGDIEPSATAEMLLPEIRSAHAHLLNAVWGPESADQSHYLRVHFAHLRRKLKAAGIAEEIIRNEPGIGYRLVSGRW